MSTGRDRSPGDPPDRDQLIVDQRRAGATIEEAEEARRRAAEIGDYATAERWYLLERALAAQAAPADHH